MKEEDVVNLTVDRGGQQIIHFSDKCQIKSIKPLSNKTIVIEIANRKENKL